MCTVTLSYDHNNALARKKLAELLKTGLFEQQDVQAQPLVVTDADVAAHKQETEDFLYGSKLMAAKAFNNKL